jgi:hypothetical protein
VSLLDLFAGCIVSLCMLNSGMVFRGVWNKMPVAVKVLSSGGDIFPTSKVRLTGLSPSCTLFDVPIIGHSPGDQGECYG